MAVMLSWWALMAVVGSLCAGWVSVFWRLVRGFAVGVTAVVMTSDRPVWCSGRFNWLLPPEVCLTLHDKSGFDSDHFWVGLAASSHTCMLVDEELYGVLADR